MSEYAWLIEAPGAYYLAVRDLGGPEFHWTRDHLQALRFYNAQQADAAMMAIRGLNRDLFKFAENLADARPVEHAWVDRPAVEAAGE